MPGNVDISHDIGEKCPGIDRRLGALAARQHGVVSRAQLRALGLGPAAVRYRQHVGRLHRVQVGVYAVGHDCMPRLGRYMAAMLTCGTDALVSQQSATSLHGVLDSARELIDVTVPGHGPRRRAGIAIHRCQDLHPDDRAVVDGIPVTSLARTLRDLAAVVPARRLERAFEEAERIRILDLGALAAVAERRRRNRGAKRFERMLESLHQPSFTRSELERRFLDLCNQSGLPSPLVNAAVEGMEVDFHWPAHGLVVEIDGFEYHRTRAAFERDRDRDLVLQLAGLRVVRLTATSIDRGADRLASLLSRPARPGARPAG